ncbi:MAG: hypothetical protein KDE47_25150 [Caldilineaceae bacterium]|nr:hypothetical protein [Caldilineaceae bacterium]
MKIGILNAIPHGDDIRWNHTPVDAYVRFLQSAHAPFTYRAYDLLKNEFPTIPDECDAYLISGSPSGVYDADAWIAQLGDFIRAAYQAEKKLVGVCFGHQILAHALGGFAAKSEKGWGLGRHTVDIYAHAPWMDHKPASASFYYAHHDQVMELPPQARLLGGNDFCPNAFFTIDGRVLGMQAHPEFSTTIMQDVLTVVEADVEPTCFARAQDSLDDGAPDNDVAARWVVDFLCGSRD